MVKEHLDLPVLLDPEDIQGLRVQKEQTDMMDRQVLQVHKDVLVVLDNLVSRELKDLLVKKGAKETRVFQVNERRIPECYILFLQ